MKKIVKNLILIIVFSVIAIAFNSKVYAAGIGMSINKSSAYVGDSFSVTISGINGKVKISGNSNISLSTSGTQWVEGSMTITGTTKSVGTGTITVTPIDVSTTGANPVEVTSTASKSIKISEKPAATTPVTPTQTPTTTNKTTTTKKVENKKTEKIVETKEKEEAKPELGIHSLKLIAVKENGEEVEVSLDKEFNIKTFDYTCNITNDTKTLKIEKEAYEYNDIVQISGLDEELKVGENTITLKLSSDGKEVIYTIKVTREEKLEIDETLPTNAEPEKQKTERIIVSIPLIWFIVLEVALVIVSATVTVFVMRYLKNSKGKKTKN